MRKFGARIRFWMFSFRLLFFLGGVSLPDRLQRLIFFDGGSTVDDFLLIFNALSVKKPFWSRINSYYTIAEMEREEKVINSGNRNSGIGTM